VGLGTRCVSRNTPSLYNIIILDSDGVVREWYEKILRVPDAPKGQMLRSASFYFSFGLLLGAKVSVSCFPPIKSKTTV